MNQNQKKKTRICGLVLMFAVLFCAMTGVVSAAAPEISGTVDGFRVYVDGADENMIRIEYDGERLEAGTEYIIMMAAGDGDKIDQNTIQYIDQTTAAADGSIKFAVNPKAMQNAVLLLSGKIDGVNQQIKIASIAATLRGDVVNNDGFVDADDVLGVLRHALKAAVLTDETALEAADVNGDYCIDMQDAIMIMRYVLNAIPTL